MKKLWILFVLCICTNSFAQNLQTSPFISVTGTAEKEIIPNEINIAIVLKETMNGKLKSTIVEQEKRLLDELRKHSIDLKKITFEDASASQLTIRKKTNDLMNVKRYELKLNTLQEVNQAINAFDEADIKSFYISEMSHSEIEAYRKEVKILALQAAKNKAKYLLESIDQKVGNALEVVEVTEGNAIIGRSNVAYPKDEEYNKDIGIKPIVVKYSMQAKFEIK